LIFLPVWSRFVRQAVNPAAIFPDPSGSWQGPAQGGQALVKLIFILAAAGLGTICLKVMNVALGPTWLALAYAAAALVVPGLILAALMSDPDQDSPARTLSLALILGLAGVAVSYFAYVLTGVRLFLFLAFCPWVLLVFGRVRSGVGVTLQAVLDRGRACSRTVFVILGLVALFSLLFAVAWQPSPGMGPVSMDYHSLVQASLQVSMEDSFPGQTGPGQPIRYNTLLQILGVHFTALTKTPAHLFMINYVYLILVPLLILALLALLSEAGLKGSYLAYGLALLLFGSGFFYGRWFMAWVYSPNLLGLVIFVSLATLFLAGDRLRTWSWLTAAAAGPFLLVGARFHGGLCLAGGLVILGLWQWRAGLTNKLKGFVGLSLLFGLLGYFVFIFGLKVPAEIKSSYFLFDYFVHKTPLVEQLQRALEVKEVLGQLGSLKFVILSLFGALFWPWGMIRHLAFALPVVPRLIGRWRRGELAWPDKVLISLALSAYLLIIVLPTDQVYALSFGYKCLLVLFLVELQRAGLFKQIGEALAGLFSKVNLFNLKDHSALVKVGLGLGWLALLVMPFHSLRPQGPACNEFRLRNLYASTVFYRPGRLQPAVKAESGRRLDKETYQALSFIRQKTGPEAVVVAPGLVLGRGHKKEWFDFYITALAERAAYVENRADNFLFPQPEPAKVAHLADIRSRGRLDEALMSDRFVFMLTKPELEALGQNYRLAVLYSNQAWVVAKLAGPGTAG